MNITTADRFRSVVFHSECQQRLYTVACSQYSRCQSRVFPHILQNAFRAIGHRTVHRPLCHEYLAPDRTTFSSLSSFYTVLWHITLKAIRKITEFLTCLKHATSRPIQVIPYILQNTFRAIGHRTVHRPLCHEYLAPDRTTFSGLPSFYTVLWHITLKAICKNNIPHVPQTRHPRPTQVILFKIALSGESPPSPDKLISLPVCPAIQVFHRTNLCPIAKPNRRSQNCKKRLEYRNAMGASYLILLK